MSTDIDEMEDRALYTGRNKKGELWFLYWDEEHLITFDPSAPLEFYIYHDTEIQDMPKAKFTDIIKYPNQTKIALMS